jgi:hypothetical protein
MLSIIIQGLTNHAALLDKVNIFRHLKTFENINTIIIIIIISLAYDPSKLTGMNLFCVEQQKIYCSIIFANHVESTTFIKRLYKLN